MDVLDEAANMADLVERHAGWPGAVGASQALAEVWPEDGAQGDPKGREVALQFMREISGIRVLRSAPLWPMLGGHAAEGLLFELLW